MQPNENVNNLYTGYTTHVKENGKQSWITSRC